MPVQQLESRILLAAHIFGDSTPYPTIQAAVDAASPGAVINVDPGVYPELVTINKQLTIRGAQAGVDARTSSRLAGASESVVTGYMLDGGAVTSAFYVNANDVTIDGFTVQGNTSAGKYGAGIVLAPSIHGSQILDNVIQNNISGLFLSNNSSTDAALIQHNAFLFNNNPGSNGGRGIYTDGGVSGGNLTNVTIDSNFFLCNHGSTGTTTLEAAIALESRTVNSQSNIRITNNVMQGNGKGVLAYNATGLLIQGNTITTIMDEWSGALRFEGGVTNTTIQNNTIEENTAPAVTIDYKGYSADSSGFVVTHNNFYSNSYITNPIYGNKVSLYVASGTYDGNLDARYNWWGSASGPSGDGAGTGDAVLANGNSVDYSSWATSPIGTVHVPFDGIPASTAFPIQAENVDHGGEGIAYHDLDPGNNGGAYGSSGVDVQATPDVGGGYCVGWAAAGEWIDYSVVVPRSGNYRLDFRVANGQGDPGAFHLELDGVNVSGKIVVNSTGGWQTWKTLSGATVPVSAGPHLLRIVFDSNGSGGAVCNLNWFQFTPVAIPLMGDVNGDGTVNLADFLLLTRDFGMTGASWSQGDLNSDGTVNLADLLILTRNFGRVAPPAALAMTAAPSVAAEPMIGKTWSARRVRT